MKNLLIIYDSPGWAMHRRANALARWKPSDWQVYTTDFHSSKDIDLHKYDVIFSLAHFDIQPEVRTIMQSPGKPIGVASWTLGPGYKEDLFEPTYNLVKNTGYMIINSRMAWKHYGALPRTCNISNGVDVGDWYSESHILNRLKRVLWCGNVHQQKQKGYEIACQAREKLERIGFECSFRPYDREHIKMVDWKYTTDQQRQWYNSGAIYLVTSRHEGTPNVALEALACGCALVSTNVGNIPELSPHCRVVCERNALSIVNCVKSAWEIRETLFREGRLEIWTKWTYGPEGNRAAVYFELFNKLLDGEVPESCSFSHWEKHDIVPHPIP